MTHKRDSLASQPIPQCRSFSILADTESDWRCRTEWGWLARLQAGVTSLVSLGTRPFVQGEWVLAYAYIQVVPMECNYV